MANFVTISEENFFTGTRIQKDGKFLTNKEDRDYHGVGLASIRMTAENYGGTMNCTVDGDLFRITLCIPIRSIENAKDVQKTA